MRLKKKDRILDDWCYDGLPEWTHIPLNVIGYTVIIGITVAVIIFILGVLFITAEHHKP
jgi:hypothetical protein